MRWLYWLTPLILANPASGYDTYDTYDTIRYIAVSGIVSYRIVISYRCPGLARSISLKLGPSSNFQGS
jgi:hypothetical protein